MLSPAEGLRGVVNFVLECIVAGAGKSCAPVIVGVGIGGTFDECAWLAKKAATIRKLNAQNPDKRLKILEEKLLAAVNDTGIGPMGLGGKFTALAVNVEVADTHISQLPVAVNLQCWKGQRAEAVISEDLEVSYVG
jgi:fumarate hydratase subunit alpha/L(+)-tartrate dehydratase alpha subunit